MKSNEVKFRVWDNESKEFNKDKEVLLSSANKIYRIHTITGELQQLRDEHLEVELCIGLDQNGKELYEGDIVRFCNVKGRLYKVEIDKNQTFRAVLTPLNNTSTKEGGLSNTLLAEYCEIIGNIHENPELLKEKE